jgi:hypothetical protein
MKFKCLVSGTIVEFTQPVDIESTLKHPQYQVVVEPKPEVKPKVVAKTTDY